jgi:hypothetical protein
MNSTQDPAVQVTAAIIFALALGHSFAAKQFERLAQRYPKHAGLFHLAGEVEVEVEVVFGFWAIVLVLAMAAQRLAQPPLTGNTWPTKQAAASLHR